jgi:hypothetical protein
MRRKIATTKQNINLRGSAALANIWRDVISIGTTTTDDGQVVFALKYRTSLKKDDQAALRKEADAYWQFAVNEVESSGRLRAVFTAVGHVPGEKGDWTADFVFARRGPGNWHTQEPEDRSKIDEPFARAFFERFDLDAQLKLTDAMLLYIAPEWVQRTRSETKGLVTRDIGRQSLSQGMHLVNFVGQNLTHKREILGIVLGEDGRSARVDSRETDAFDVLGTHREIVSRTADFIELRGRFVLMTKTVKTIEKYEKTAAN